MDLPTIKQNAYTASDNLANLQTSAPAMLNELKQNLVGIFAKDNPLIQARNNAVTDYLNAPSQSRVNVLPTNMPTVEGRALTLSPTQQNAITTAQTNAALVPALGLNQLVAAQYGTIGDIIKGAAGAYDAEVNAASTRASSLLDMYKTAVAEAEAKNKAATSGGIDLATILAAIQQKLGVQNPATQRSGFFEDIPTANQAPQANPLDPSTWSIAPASLPQATKTYSASGVPDVVVPAGNNNLLEAAKKIGTINNKNTKSSGLSLPSFSNLFNNLGINLTL